MYGLLGVNSLRKSKVQFSKLHLCSHFWDVGSNRTFSILSKEYKISRKINRNRYPLVVNYMMSDYYTEKSAVRPTDERKTKTKKPTLKTTITKVTPSSTKQVKAVVQLFRTKELFKFINSASSKPHQKEKSEPTTTNNENEDPLLLIPGDFNLNQQHLEEIYNSYVEFIKSYDEIQRNYTVPLPNTDDFDISRSSFPMSYDNQEQAIAENETEIEKVFPEKENKEINTQIEYTNEAKSRHASLVKSLKAYLDVCVSNKMENRGLSVLLNYRKRNKESEFKVNLNDINLYTILMSGFATRGNLRKISQIYNILTEDHIKLTPQAYATIFECLGRMEASPKNLEKLHHFECIAKQNQISLNDIMDKSFFVRDQREVVLKAIHRFFPQFEPKYTAPNITYTNSLLSHLNDDVRPIQEKLDKMTEPCDGSEIFNSKKGFDSADLKNLLTEQMKIEMKSQIEIKSIFRRTSDAEVERHRQLLNGILTKWYAEICEAFKKNLATAQHSMNSKNSNRVNIYPYLCLLKPEQYADLLVDELKLLGQNSLAYSPTTSEMSATLGRKVQIRYQNELKLKQGIIQKMKKLYSEYCDGVCLGLNSDNSRQLWQRLVYHQTSEGPSWNVAEVKWPRPVLTHIGDFLFKLLLRDIKIDISLLHRNRKHSQYVPILYSVFRSRDLKTREEVTPHPMFSKLYQIAQPETLTFDANLIPMVCPPLPWTSLHSGGYLITQSDLLRLPYQATQQLQRIADMPQASLYPVLDALNQLGSISWRVNTRILDIVIEIFNKGGSDKLHVSKAPDVVLPKAGKVDYASEEQINTCSSKEISWKNSQKQVQEQAELYSLWCDTLYKLSMANHFRDKPFWMPHNMDFRGRVYPIPPHLNHLSSDLSRSLLLFNQKQPLGRDGLNWLKLHCINLTGKKKRDSVRGRLEYAEQVMGDILDSADNPLTGKMFWLDSDEPWQTLASCIEIANASRSPYPEKYMSSFPIHQDGSCNGLQHYAALGRDKAGAASVNLSPSEKPQDVYSTIANLVESSRCHDANNRNAIAIALEGYIKRKVIKQTVMTTVYGVTIYGARLQIEKQLKNLDDFPNDLVKPAACYLANKTFGSLGTIFRSAQHIQDWFTDCARFISKECQSHVEWITPLGLPVVQPYVNHSKLATKQKSVSNVEQLREDSFCSPNNRKEKNAFPPNFIHSLDSCHMMLTSLNCERAGLTFVSVHDCFWTHACTVPTMSRICRDQFVLLHSQPILEDLSAFFCNKFQIEQLQTEKKRKRKKKNSEEDSELENKFERNILKDIPEKGTFDLKEVLKSVYFFS